MVPSRYCRSFFHQENMLALELCIWMTDKNPCNLVLILGRLLKLVWRLLQHPIVKLCVRLDSFGTASRNVETQNIE